MKVPAISQLNKQQYLDNLRGRARFLQGVHAEKVRAFFDNQHKLLTNTGEREEAEKNYRDLVVAARAGNGESVSQLAALRVDTIQNFLLASANALAFFETNDLAKDEVPYIQNQTRNEINVTYMGSDGMARKIQAIKQQAELRVDLRFLTTDEYEYPLVDPYRGDVAASALAQVNIADDLEKQLSALLWPYIRGTQGNFLLTGPKPSRVYVPHSTIDVNNLPPTNVLTPLGDVNTATSLWRKSCLDAILTYCAAWGGNAFLDGPIVPVAVYVPSAHVMGWLQQVTLTNLANMVVDQIFENGYVISYGGNTKWALIGDNQLTVAAATAYVRTNKPVGKFFTKTSLDEAVVDDTKAMKIQNKESITMKKLIGVGLPSPWAVNAQSLQYRTVEGVKKKLKG